MEQKDWRSEKIKDGKAIVKEGTWAYGAYVIQEGKAKVWKNIDGKPVLIGALNKGDIFGEMAFIGGWKRAATVTADGDVEVRIVERNTFMEAIDKLPEDVRRKLNAMCSNLTQLNEVYGHLILLFKDIEKMKAVTVDVNSLQKEIVQMPDLSRRMLIAMAHRLNTGIKGCAQQAAQLKEAGESLDSLSLTLTKNPVEQ
ncbi:MAG: cyclic nucleotide-binding domain-containing protein [Candidatus Binatia bacterium]